MTTVFYISKHDGTKSLPLCIEAVSLWNLYSTSETRSHFWHAELSSGQSQRSLPQRPRVRDAQFHPEQNLPPVGNIILGPFRFPVEQDLQSILPWSSTALGLQGQCPSIILDRTLEVHLSSNHAATTGPSKDSS